MKTYLPWKKSQKLRAKSHKLQMDLLTHDVETMEVDEVQLQTSAKLSQMGMITLVGKTCALPGLALL
jgi:hypothetical protein